MTPVAEILFLSHGGGPLPLLGDPGHREMVDLLRSTAARIARPEAILVISAHWEAERPTLNFAPRPGLLYDYYGFPEESYSLEYPCPGAPTLAEELWQQLSSAGFDAGKETRRGLDHGVFVPLMLMYPEADIPCVQLSLVNDLDAGTHLALGKALRSLQRRNLLVIGSGFSFHNMKAFGTGADAKVDEKNRTFEDWLRDVLTDPSLSEAERFASLRDWESAPHARFCHPREEHLLPLHVCLGMAGRACDRHDSVTIMDREASLAYWSFGQR